MEEYSPYSKYDKPFFPTVCREQEAITVAVSLMDGRSITLTVNSASTSAEVCDSIFQKIDLQDTYGFSLYAAMHEKVCIIWMASRWTMK